MKKFGIIINIVCFIAIGFGAWLFVGNMQKDMQTAKQESKTLQQKVQVLEAELTTAQDKLKKETFINPIFYEKLEAIATEGRDTYLTLNSIVYSNSNNIDNDTKYLTGWTREDCELLENEQDYVVLKCERYSPIREKFFSSYSRFTIKPCGEREDYLNCRYLVIQNGYDNGINLDRVISTEHYTIR